MNLYERILRLWTAKERRLSSKWATALTAARPQIEAASQQFREWKPLRFYLSVTEASKAASRPRVEFSVRFHGQEVARLDVGTKGAKPLLRFTEDHRRNNRSYFGLPTPAKDVVWEGASEFRRHFKHLEESVPAPRVHSREHEIESRIIQQMEGNSSKFSGTMPGGIQPVLLSGFPFQCPVPISSSRGSVRAKRGNLDIVARRGSGRGTRLSVWELKAPGEFVAAVDQVYAYVVVLALMLRAENGAEWYRLFGFSGAAEPKKLNLEAVVAVTSDRKKEVEAAVEKLVGAQNPLLIEQLGVQIRLCAAYYEPQTLKIDFRTLA